MLVFVTAVGVILTCGLLAARLRTRRVRSRHRARRSRWAAYQRLWNTVVRPQRVKRLPNMRNEG